MIYIHGFSRIGIRMIVPCRGARMSQPKTPINSAQSSGIDPQSSSRVSECVVDMIRWCSQAYL